jgi:hypothetical protein
MTYKRRELCEEHTYYEVKDFTARTGAPKKALNPLRAISQLRSGVPRLCTAFFRIKYVALTLCTNACVYSHAFNWPCQKFCDLGYIS